MADRLGSVFDVLERALERRRQSANTTYNPSAIDSSGLPPRTPQGPRGPGRPPKAPSGGNTGGSNGDDEEELAQSSLSAVINSIANAAGIKFNPGKYTQSQFRNAFNGLSMPQIERMRGQLPEDFSIDDILDLKDKIRKEVGLQGIQNPETEQSRIRQSQRFFSDLLEEIRGQPGISNRFIDDYQNIIKNFKDVNTAESLMQQTQEAIANDVNSGIDRIDSIQNLFRSQGIETSLSQATKKPTEKKVAATPKGPVRLTDADMRSMSAIASDRSISGNIRQGAARTLYTEVIRRSDVEQSKQEQAVPYLNQLKSPIAMQRFADGITSGEDLSTALSKSRELDKNFARSQMGLFESLQVYGSYATTQGFKRGTLNFLGAARGMGVAPEVMGVAGGVGGLLAGVQANVIQGQLGLMGTMTGSQANPAWLEYAFLLGMNPQQLAGLTKVGANFGNKNNFQALMLAQSASMVTGVDASQIAQTLLGLRQLGSSNQAINQMGIFSTGGFGNATPNQMFNIINSAANAGINITPVNAATFGQTVGQNPQATTLAKYAESILNDPALLQQFGAVVGLTTAQQNQLVAGGDINQVLSLMQNSFKSQIGVPTNSAIGAMQLGGLFGQNFTTQDYLRFIGTKFASPISSMSYQQGQIASFMAAANNTGQSLPWQSKLLNFFTDLVDTPAGALEELFGNNGGGAVPIGASSSIRQLQDMQGMTTQNMLNLLDLRDYTAAQLKASAGMIGGNSPAETNLALSDLQRIQKLEIAFKGDTSNVKGVTAYDNTGTTSNVPFPTNPLLTNKPNSTGTGFVHKNG